MDASQFAAARKSRQLTQGEVAARMGVSQATVSRIESGERTNPATVRRYLEALGGSVTCPVCGCSLHPGRAQSRDSYRVDAGPHRDTEPLYDRT